MTAALNERTIELDHVGPITRLQIPLPDSGGVVVLRGANGVGKSHAIAAVEALYSADARKGLRASDGVPSGCVSGLGVTIRLGRSNTAKGELVCECLDGRVDPSRLVDPGLKDPLAADSRRLATLVRLAGIQISAATWEHSLGLGGIQIPLDLLVTDDPVETADRIRRRLHDAALAAERLSASHSAEAVALSRSITDLDLTEECDREVLVDRFAQAMDAMAEAKARREAFMAAVGAQAKAMISLHSLRVTMLNPYRASEEEELAHADWQEADREVREAEAELDRLRAVVTQLEKDLVALRGDRDDAAVALAARTADVQLAAKQKEAMDALQSSVDAQLPPNPSDDEMERLAQAHRDAQLAVERGETIRMAQKTHAKSEALAGEASRMAAEAERMRAIARSTDQVLEQALVDAGFVTIRVHDGRLCVPSERGLEPFSDLSHGERWRLAIELASRGMPRGAVLPVCQEAWESLDPDNRLDVCRLARDAGLVLITAEATGGPLRAELAESGIGEQP